MPLNTNTDLIVVQNSLQPVPTGPIVTENTRTGFESTYFWKGRYEDCFAQRASMRVGGVYSHIIMRPSGDGDWQIEGVTPFDEFGNPMTPVPSVNELEVEIAQIALAFSAKLNTLMSNAGIAAVLLICADYQSGRYATYDGNGHMTDGGWAAATAAVGNAVGVTGDSSSIAIALFTNVVGRGLQAALDYRTVYRRTLTAATPAQVTASYTGAKQIWTTTEVQSFEDISPNDWFQLPANAQWIKSPPNVTATARQKTQLTYNYTECKQATALLYDAFNSAVLLDS